MKTYINLAYGFIWAFQVTGRKFDLVPLRKDGSLWLCVNSRDPNNLTIREPMLTAFEPMPIEAANLWIAWAVPDIVFHPVELHRHIPWKEDS